MPLKAGYRCKNSSRRLSYSRSLEKSAMHALLAAHLLAWRKETLYPKSEDFVFPSLRLKGEKPPAVNMLVADYLRVAAKKAGVGAPPRTFGFHTFRGTLASVLVKMKVDVKTVQEILRHQNSKSTPNQ